MQPIQQKFSVPFQYTVHFTNGLFKLDNPLFKSIFSQDVNAAIRKLLFVIDSEVAKYHPSLIKEIFTYTQQHTDTFKLAAEPIVMPGGEACKNDYALVEQLQQAVNDYGIDRHSYIVAIGGGALLDMVGFAAAVSHRGIRLIRIPTTVLSQNDSGVGVKNSINAFHKKNFLGTFAPPFAVLNDFDFLLTLDDRDWRAGISEAVKVALIKDVNFWQFLRKNAKALAARDMPAMQVLIHRCAQMHMDHIAGGDPFEMGSSRPLDFGHWSAHKLEQLSEYSIRHGEAVAMGIALDCTYSYFTGLLSKDELDEILETLEEIGFSLFSEYWLTKDSNQTLTVIKGLSEFREHLGGKLTIMLLSKIGKGVEVNQVDPELVKKSIYFLQEYSLKVKV
ncbi:3-dehydroquinate synthase [Rhodocytophaga rosea]|uniref:3-dehydroquinate synthase n=1 Tax=Rhodocytophaga rosea TaxID=2704465 RepID=A0A6C0GIF7_9BACT|nr:3-dehydroquinate synthase [Rhodocytophaga rosea]QHT67695.1 3-dehydroquinate synthase [Rhodocytophaga rosea]